MNGTVEQPDNLLDEPTQDYDPTLSSVEASGTNGVSDARGTTGAGACVNESADGDSNIVRTARLQIVARRERR